MGEHTKTYHPISVVSMYSGQTMYSPANICDGNASTFGYLKGATTNGIAMRMHYNFSDIPSNATLVSAYIGGSSCKWKVSTSSSEIVWLHQIRDRSTGSLVTDEWAYGASTTRFGNRSASANTEYAFSPTQYNLKTLSNKTALSIAKMRQTETLSDGKVASVISISLGFRKSANTSTNHYLNMLPITVTYTVPDYTLTVNSSNTNKGTVTGGGSYEYGSTVTITATAKSGYKFVKWSDGNTNASRTVTVTGAATYTAEFEADKTNNIYIGTTPIKAIYIGNTPIKEVYIGTTKIYG